VSRGQHNGSLRPYSRVYYQSHYFSFRSSCSVVLLLCHYWGRSAAPVKSFKNSIFSSVRRDLGSVGRTRIELSRCCAAPIEQLFLTAWAFTFAITGLACRPLTRANWVQSHSGPLSHGRWQQTRCARVCVRVFRLLGRAAWNDSCSELLHRKEGRNLK
jgi:hypothetical protein